MFKSGEKGSLLLEVLIASVVLATGVLACLNVFSGSIHSSNQIASKQKVNEAINRVLFEWFLNPVSFDSSGISRVKTEDLKYDLQIQTVPLVKLPGETEGDEVKGFPAAAQFLNPLAIEFFEVDFKAKPQGRGSEYEQRFYLFRYGFKKI